MPRFTIEVREKNPHIAIPIKNRPKTPNHIAIPIRNLPNHISIPVRSASSISKALNAAARARRIETMKAPRPPSPNRRNTRKKSPGPSKLRSSSSSRRRP